jgi:transcriptional regulator with XRE-family HTH domain
MAPRKGGPFATLADYIAATGDTQVAIARAVKASQAQISRIVNGTLVPRPALAVRLADYANVPLDSFARVYLARLKRRRGQAAREVVV